MKLKNGGAIFDFDDTLVETIIYYDKAKEQFAAKMSELGFPAEESLEVMGNRKQYEGRHQSRNKKRF